MLINFHDWCKKHNKLPKESYIKAYNNALNLQKDTAQMIKIINRIRAELNISKLSTKDYTVKK